jgi:tetratricopeptide (TPR) repeat protein
MDAWHRVAAAGVRAAERRGDPREVAGVRYFQGVANRFAGRLAEAEADFEAVFAVGAELDDVPMRLRALWRLLGIAKDRGDFPRVLELYRTVREEPEGHRYPEDHAFALLGGGYALLGMDRAAEAARLAADVLAGPEAAEPMLRITALRLLGHARLALDDAEAALRTFREVAAVARATGHEANVAASRGDAAEALSRLGRHAEALDEGEAANTWSVATGETHRELHMREAFGRICLAAGDLDRAAHQFRRSLELAEAHGYTVLAEQARLGLARAQDAPAATSPAPTPG